MKEEKKKKKEVKEEIPRELAEFIPAISARRARRFDARARIFPPSGNGGNATEPRGEESCSRELGVEQDVIFSVKCSFIYITREGKKYCIILETNLASETKIS